MTNQCCGLVVIFWGFISHLIDRKTINIPESFSGVHGFTGKTVTFLNVANILTNLAKRMQHRLEHEINQQDEKVSLLWSLHSFLFHPRNRRKKESTNFHENYELCSSDFLWKCKSLHAAAISVVHKDLPAKKRQCLCLARTRPSCQVILHGQSGLKWCFFVALCPFNRSHASVIFNSSHVHQHNKYPVIH